MTLFPGLADLKVSVDGELKLTPEETAEIAAKLHQGMHLGREIANRLLSFLRHSVPESP